jgi:type IV pilus assembly protein PilN
MIKINLLPQEERRKREPFNTTIILAAFGVVVIFLAMGYGWYWLNQAVGGLQASITQGQAELKRYEEEVKLVDKFRDDKKKLEEKIKVIESLVGAQGGPVRLLDEVSRAVPNEVWLTAIARTGKKMDVSGIAFSNFSVANFMTNLGKAAPLISNVDLVVSEKAVVEQVPVERFSITMEVKEGKGS